jgi:hypothetical protein
VTIGVGIFVTALGAILAYAVDVQTEGFDWHAAGVITMIAGIVITVAAAIATMASRRRYVAPYTTAAVAPTTVVEDRYVESPVVERAPRVVEQRVVRRT